MSIAASEAEPSFVHGLKDDLESLLYVVLYSALRWLPVESHMDLEWWLDDFFGVCKPGRASGCYFKFHNALTRDFTDRLTSTRSQVVVEWLKAAMDLHYYRVGRTESAGPNPKWDNGEALKAMWEEILARELPNDDRCKNPVPGIGIREEFSLHATYTTQTTPTSLFGSHALPILPISTATLTTSTSLLGSRVLSILPPPAITLSRAQRKRPASETPGGDVAAGSSDPTNKIRRLRQKGEHDVEDDHREYPSPRKTARTYYQRGGRGGKLQRTDSQVTMPLPLSGLSPRSSRSTSTKGKVPRDRQQARR